MRDGKLTAVEVAIGTYFGASDGSLGVTACAGSECRKGSAPLEGAEDNASFRIALDDGPLPLRKGSDVILTFTHEGGRAAVAIWTWPEPGGTGRVPGVLMENGEAPAGSPRLVFRSRTTDVYAVDGAAPYFEARGCELAVASRERLSARCPAPATLLRRELSDPGWSARVNGAAAPVGFAPPLFQKVELQAGASQVTFAYRPPYMGAALGAAMLALSAMLITSGGAVISRIRGR